MDPLEADWFSKLEADDDDDSDFMINQWDLKSMEYNCFDDDDDLHHIHIPPPHNVPSSTIQQQIICPSQKLFETTTTNNNNNIILTKKIDLAVSTSSSSVPSSSTTLPNIISFGDSNSNPVLKNPSNTNTSSRMYKYFTVKNEPPTSSSSWSSEVMNFSSPSQQGRRGVVEIEYGGGGGSGDQLTHNNYNNNTKRAAASNRTPLQALDHVLAERKRRERLSERFVALSAMIPGLKKLDKASVLGGAIKYLKQMEERVKMLEEQNERKSTSCAANNNNNNNNNVISIKRTRIVASSDHDQTTGSSSNNSDDYSSSGITGLEYDDHNHDQSASAAASPEIEVRISDINVLIRVYCEKRNGIIKEILSEIEKLHLGIISSSVIPFGTATLNITVIAQMDKEDCKRAQEIANTIRMAIQSLM